MVRKSRGRVRDEGASFPVASTASQMPPGYAEILREIKLRIRHERLRLVLEANSAVNLVYWDIGRTILERQGCEGWGAKVIDRLATDLREAFPEMKGFSPRNLLFMRSFAEKYPDIELVKQLVSQLPWGHIVRLLQRVKEPSVRDWYTRKAIDNGWSRSTLELQIDSDAHLREGAALTNFQATLPPPTSDMAVLAFKDPYLFDFLGTADPRREREVELALVEHVQRFLLELGSGFAFMGRQVHLEFKSQDYYIDLLFYHVKLRCHVVIELKAIPFQPEFVGKLNMYLSAVDELLRHPEDRPTIGLLLCRSKDRVIAEYALRDINKPMGVADWKKHLLESLPKDLQGSLPSIEEIEAELDVLDD